MHCDNPATEPTPMARGEQPSTLPLPRSVSYAILSFQRSLPEITPPLTITRTKQSFSSLKLAPPCKRHCRPRESSSYKFDARVWRPPLLDVDTFYRCLALT